VSEQTYSVDVPDNVVLMPHNPDCVGCGPANETGLHLQVRRLGDEFVTEVSFGRRFTGSPGIAHGGAVAMACDDLLGYAIFSVPEPAVTRSLQVQYDAPVLLGPTYRMAARLVRREGRKLFLTATGTAPDGSSVFSAEALFLIVDFAHFLRFGPLRPDSRIGALYAAQQDRERP
jgi:acyl-coenzyme A thioesterase PaaI-like protein